MRARPVRYDLLVGDDIIGIISVVADDRGTENWVLEMDVFGNHQVSVKFATETAAHQMAEEWALAQRRVLQLVDIMRRTGIDFTVR